MSASLRFLGVALIAWVGLRAASLGMVPGSEGFSLTRTSAAATGVPAAASAGLPAIVPTQFPPLDQPAPAAPPPPEWAASAPLMAMPHWVRIPLPAYYPAPAAPYPAYVPASLPAPRRASALLPEPEPLFYSPIPQLDEWPLSRMASAAIPPRRSATGLPSQSVPAEAAKARLDRLQLTAWALLRPQKGGIIGAQSIAPGGTLGASQAGARLAYNLDRHLAVTMRTSTIVGGRGGEVAAGVRYRPFRAIPVALTAERRQAIGRWGGGRNAFALFAEGGVYRRPIAWGLELDGYAQGGIVGARRRDLFFDGGATLSRPLFGRYSAGFGVWGGVQPGLYRVDVGPRVSIKVRDNIRAHIDWRQRVAGNAEPGSGPALTLAADF